MTYEIREICGDYALDINFKGGDTYTIYFNSRKNALNVKRILEIDGSIPNCATVCDMVEVVRCKDCKYYQNAIVNEGGFLVCPASSMDITEYDYCSYGVRKEGKQ